MGISRSVSYTHLLADIQRISNIQRLKSQGFTLEEMQRVYSGSGRQELEALYREKIAEMERKIAYDNHVLARMSASARTLQDVYKRQGRKSSRFAPTGLCAASRFIRS